MPGLCSFVLFVLFGDILFFAVNDRLSFATCWSFRCVILYYHGIIPITYHCYTCLFTLPLSVTSHLFAKATMSYIHVFFFDAYLYCTTAFERIALFLLGLGRTSAVWKRVRRSH